MVLTGRLGMTHTADMTFCPVISPEKVVFWVICLDFISLFLLFLFAFCEVSSSFLVKWEPARESPVILLITAK